MAIQTWPTGSGGYTGPDITVSNGTWNMNLSQTAGTTILSSNFYAGGYFTIGNTVSVRMFVELEVDTISAAEEMRFEIDLPIAANFSTNNEIQGSAQVTMQANSSWVAGMQATVSSNRVEDTLALYVYVPGAIVSGNTLDVAIVYQYDITG